MFIVLEGLDGAGTTTQCELLARALRDGGQKVVTTREPSDGPLGTLLRQVLRGRLLLPDHSPVTAETIALWFAADRLDHIAATVEPTLLQGGVVISDRYVHSSLAYQSVECGLDWVNSINQRARLADVTVFVDVPASICRQRIQARGLAVERFEQEGYLERVEAIWQQALSARPEGVVRVDGTRDVQAVHLAILHAVNVARSRSSV